MDWINLDSVEQLNVVLSESKSGTAVFFKHSTSCPLSAAAKRRLEKEWETFNQDTSVYYIDLLAYRSVSNQLAEETEVKHQSPQLIVVKDGEVVYHASHLSIDAAKVASHI